LFDPILARTDKLLGEGETENWETEGYCRPLRIYSGVTSYKNFETSCLMGKESNLGGRRMTIIEKVRDTFTGCEQGTFFTRSEIINMVRTKHGVNEGSIIPSDYCYNMANKGKLADASLEKFNIFEWISRGKYRYLGENYPYSGLVLSNPRKK